MKVKPLVPFVVPNSWEVAKCPGEVHNENLGILCFPSCPQGGSELWNLQLQQQPAPHPPHVLGQWVSRAVTPVCSTMWEGGSAAESGTPSESRLSVPLPYPRIQGQELPM